MKAATTMIGRLLLWAVAVFGWAFPGPSFASPSSSPPGVWVQLVDCSALNRDVMQAIRVEVDTIFARAGVPIVWLDADATPPPDQPWGARAYVLNELPPTPTVRALFPRARGTEPLAFLGGTVDKPGPTIFLSRQAVTRRAHSPRADTVKYLARAMGRVLAHELAHRFLRRGHTEKGLLKAKFGRYELLQAGLDEIGFTRSQSAALKRVAEGRPRYPPGQSEIGLAENSR